MSNQQSLKQFFTSKIFKIPKYQRSYAWDRHNVWELFEDIQEAINANSHHYIGTVVLAKTIDGNTFNIVDGQQRVTTIILFISVLIKKLDDEDDQKFYSRCYVKEKIFKLTPLERDKDFFFQLLNGVEPDLKPDLKPESKSQRFMLEAYNQMTEIVDCLEDPLLFLKAIENLSILEFIEKNESDAIRIFQTVNDRGKVLSRMDKMKSLLFYFSNKYLDGKYDDSINDKFGEIFELYDNIKLIGEEQEINVISSKQFTEDDLLRHHHICFSEQSYDPTGQQILTNVKEKLTNFRKNQELELLDHYISRYLNSLLEYVRSFFRIISRTKNHEDYYKLFSILGLSVVYYPAITQLEKQNFLEQTLPEKNISILKMIEIIDVRVFKVREYAGKKYVAQFSYALNSRGWTIQELEQYLSWFNSFEISNDRFRDHIAKRDYHQQTGLLRTLFIDYCERKNGQPYNINILKEIMATIPTIEHIFSQTPIFEPMSYGFKDTDDFQNHKHLLGNLTLLEKPINSSIQNQNLVNKVAAYHKSRFRITSELGTSIAIANNIFRKDDLIQRSEDLATDFSTRWST